MKCEGTIWLLAAVLLSPFSHDSLWNGVPNISTQRLSQDSQNKHSSNPVFLTTAVKLQPPDPKSNHPSPEKADTSSVVKTNTSLSNETATNETLITTTPKTTTTTKSKDVDLPVKGAAEAEKHSSMTIFFILLVVAICILLVHMLIQTHFYYLPESIAIVLIGALIGLVLKLVSGSGTYNWEKEEAFPPTMFFLVILPPIIFESGYNLHKGNFFHNVGSIVIFAIFGTIISALIVGGGLYLLGEAGVAYKLDIVESFAFGSLISAIDPVATLAIFHALDVDQVLYMMVFGESVLNDAVSIVLTTTILDLNNPKFAGWSGAAMFFHAVGNFCLMFVASAAIGVLFGLTSALLLKFVDLRKTPSLEFGIMLVFSYLPYGLAEGLHLSGIMAILFAGIVMSHYTHINLSPVTQITIQQTFRTIAFIAETCVFAYLGLAIFSFRHIVKTSFVIWSLVLCLIGRACNIFPLSLAVNYFRETKITRRQQFIMWFSGLRGAIAFALSLHLEFESEKRHILVSTTLIIVLFTVLFLGGSTMPMMKLLNTCSAASKKSSSIGGAVEGKPRCCRGFCFGSPAQPPDTCPPPPSTPSEQGQVELAISTNHMNHSDSPSDTLLKAEKRKKTRPGREVTLSKTKEMGETVDTDHLSELTEEEYEVNFVKPHLKGFLRIDAKYLIPFFTRRFTQQEVREGRTQMTNLTNKWYQEVRAAPSESESEQEM